MSLQENTKESLYKIQATIKAKYRPLVLRGRPNQESFSKFNVAEKRQSGASNLDLWLDSSIYPCDPATGKRPKFSSPGELLEFVGDGYSGLLGYMQRLESMSSGTSQEVRDQGIEISFLRSRIDGLIQTSAHQCTRSQNEITSIQTELINSQNCLHRMTEKCEEFALSLHAEIVKNSQAEATISALIIEHNRKLEEIWKEHDVEVCHLQEKLKKSSSALKSTQGKLQRLQKTPYGIKSQVRARKDVSMLAPNGGQAKAVRRLARMVIAPQTVRGIQHENAQTGSRKRLFGTDESQILNGRVLASMLSKKEISSMLQLPSLIGVGVEITNQILEKVGEHVDSHAVLQTCDQSGITQTGYRAIFKRFKGGIKSSGKGLRLNCLPNPHSVAKLRKEMNESLSELIGDYYSLSGTFEVAAKVKGKKEPEFLTLNNFNSFFVDLEVVQKAMIQLYGISTEEIGSNPLIFVMKMDEAEIVHGEKMERISITLMNRALNSKVTKDSEAYFSVQAEREIWPVGCFRLPKENHEVLKWVLMKTKIPEVMQAQGEGRELYVQGIGSFRVEWHISADMKTIKALYGLQGGANAKHSCIYCLQEKTKITIASEAQAQAVAKKRTPTWKGGLFAENVESKPVNGLDTLSRWKPILPVPLEQVHMCTLHALNRICEKILHLIFQHIWTIRNKEIQEIAIKDVENILSAIGMHGGNVKIFKDKELSGKNNSVPNKPSLNGAQCARLFKPSNLAGSITVWRDLIAAMKITGDNGNTRRSHIQLWVAFEKLLPFFTGLSLLEEERSSFQPLVHDWGKLFIKVFGESHVTHYIHVFVKHGPWFVKEYGSLSVWSCQGMEYSHHAAKSAYHKYTQHGGGRKKISPLLQIYEHWYRIIHHQFHNKEMKEDRIQPVIGTEEAIQKKRKFLLDAGIQAYNDATQLVTNDISSSQ